MPRSRSLTLLIALVVLVSACTGQEAEPDQATTTSGGPTTSAADGEVPGTEPAGDGSTTSSTTTTEPAVEPETLTALVDELRVGAFEIAAARFTEETGVPVEIQIAGFEDIPGLVAAGEEPVDVFVASHLDILDLAGSGLVAPLDLGGSAADVEPAAVRAVSIGADLYALPYAADVLALYWNPTLVDTPPADLADLDEACAGLKEGTVCLAMAGGGEPSLYHHYPFVSAGGGYVFAETEPGRWDVADRGLDPSLLGGLAVLEDLVAAELLPPLDAGGALDAFASGDAAYYLSGPWDLGPLDDAGLTYEVAPIPTIAGESPSPLIGVQGVATTSGDRTPIAATFVREFLLTEDVVAELQEADPRTPVIRVVISGAITDGFVAGLRAGTVIPAVSEMDAVWPAFGDAFLEVRRFGADPFAEMQAAEAAVAAALDGDG